MPFKKHLNLPRLLFIFPLLLLAISFYPLSVTITNAKFNEEWQSIKAGINNIADNSLFLHDLYGNTDFLRSNQTVHIVHLFAPDGLWIAQFDPDLVMVSNPGFNSFSRFNPMAYPQIVDTIKWAMTNEDKPSGEFVVKFSPDNKSVRNVHVYFRWVQHFHIKSGEECHYLIVVASSLEALQTIIEPSVILVFSIFLIAIIILFAVAVVINYTSDMQTVKESGNYSNENGNINEKREE